MTSQKEFVIGCFIGGVLGASAALLVPRFLNGAEARKGHEKRPRHQKGGGAALNSHAREMVKPLKPKKARSKKSTKPMHE